MPVNCGAIPSTLIESALFGHERGAFTDAKEMEKGYSEAAHKGTLFLDELGELTAQAQVKLLRAIQEGEILRVGATRPLKVDVRIIGATNRTLTGEIEAGRFREDLYLSRVLAETRGNKSEAASLVGLPSYQTLTNWLKKYGVS